MQKIINGKKYNTETAEWLASSWNGLPENDFRNMNEVLYRKKTGEFFLYGEGGAMTKYSRACGDGCCGGEAIIPMSLDEASRWVEKNANSKYESLFGEVAE